MDPEKQKIRARNNAYALLRMRPRSEFEIRQRLKLKGYDSALIDAVVEGLSRSGYIDDAKFARFWIDSRMHANPMGDAVIRHELKLKGVADSVIEAALQDKAANYDEYEVASGMAREKFERLKKLDKDKALKRLYDFLTRRGFKYDTVRKIVDEIVK